MDKSQEKVRRHLVLLTDFMNKDKNVKLKLLSWIDEYDGKIIEFHIGDSAFHMIFTKENARLEKGSYPSPDALVQAEPDFLIKLLSGEAKLSSSLLVEGKFSVWGNFHDLIAFTRIISSSKRVRK